MSVPNSTSWIQRKTRLRELLLLGHNQFHHLQSSDVDADHNKADDDEPDKSDEDQMGLALDRLLHGQQAILASNYQVLRPTQRLLEINQLKFQDMDLDLMGRLDEGQFGVVEVVRCRLERSDRNRKVYVRKRIEKRFALRTREQNSPQLERDILLAALRTSTPWAPHLLCAYHSSESDRKGMGYLNLVMEYAEGGTLWDLLESSSLRGQGELGDGAGGRISEIDLQWWIPQIVCAIGWLHELGYVHRDIKPHNFVIRLSSSPRIQLIDFGSAAPLLPPSKDGGRLVPKRYCLVPVGTCDYISPEILKAHEMALLALELEQSDSEDSRTKPGLIQNEAEVYGAETDWWSLGAMIYEMAYGVTPFWARDVRRTYERIMDHRNSLKFPSKSVPDAMQPSLSLEFEDFIKRLLTDAEFRLGRHQLLEITEHRWFVIAGVDWDRLSSTSHESNLPLPPPPHLHLPQFSYAYPDPTFPPHTGMNDINAIPNTANAEEEEEFSQPFAFSALFQSSPGVSQYNSRHNSRSHYDSHSNSDFRGENQNSPGLSILHDTSRMRKQNSGDSGIEGNESMSTAAAFIGFSWGPLKDAFINGSESVVEDRVGHFDHMAIEEDPLNAKSQKYVELNMDMEDTPRPRPQGIGQGQGRRIPSSWLTPVPTPNPEPRSLGVPGSAHEFAFSTPIRPYQTLPRGMGSTVRPAMSTPYRTPYNAGTYNGGTPYMGTLRRPLSDREAMKQLVDCVGASARKRVLESGRKVRVLNAYSSFGNGTSSLGKGNGRGGIRSGGTGSSGRSVRFEYPQASYKLKSGSGSRSDLSLSNTSSRSRSRSGGNGNVSGGSGIGKFFGRSSLTSSRSSARSYTISGASETDANDRTEGETRPNTDIDIDMDYSSSGKEMETESYTEEGTETESEAPPSPSPSPRPGSAMSILSTRSMSMTMTMMNNGNGKDREIRGGTPTATLTGTLSHKVGAMTNIKTSGVGNTDVHGRDRSTSNDSHTRIPSEAPMGTMNRPGTVGERRRGAPPAITNTTMNTAPTTTFEDGRGFEETLDELEVKHASIMEDICDLERRLERVRGHQTQRHHLVKVRETEQRILGR